jgi:AcrR family transcriptional regulator
MSAPRRAPAEAQAAPPVRRSRSERSADSRQLILDSTLACLFEQGYARTTTLTIQARAGVSRGRLLHQFPSRDGLLVAACQHLVTHHLAELENWATSVLDNEDTDDEDADAISDRLDGATDQLWATFRQPYFWGAIELWTAARTDPGLRETLLPQERRLGVAIRRVVDVLYGPAITCRPGYATMRELVFTSMRGVAMTYAFDQRDPAHDPHLPLWRQASRRLLDARPA